MKNKTLIIAIIILVFAIAGVFMLSSIFSTKDTAGNTNPSESTPGFIFGLFGEGNDGGDGGEIIDNGFGIGQERPLLKLRKISETPTAGFISFEEDDEVFVRYTERATGHIYEARTAQPTIKRLTNTTIPRVYEAVWINENSSVIRYLDEKSNIKSFYAEVVKSSEEDSTEGKIEGIFLKDNIKDIISYGEKILSLSNTKSGSQFIVSDIDGSNSFQVFESPLKEWLIQKPKTGTLVLTTKPSYQTLGYLYFLNTNNGELKKILGGVAGMTSLVSSDAQNILYSKNMNLYKYNTLDSKNTYLLVKTLPEKCVWDTANINIYCGIPLDVPEGNFPDDWYQGTVSFGDSIYKINTNERGVELLVSPVDFSGEEIDVIKPSLSPNGEFLFFINKKDLSLWSLDLRENKVKIDENIDLGTTTEAVAE